MAEGGAALAPRGALAGLDLPAAYGGATLAAAGEAAMLWIAPFRGREAAVAAALGADLPAPGRSAALADGSLLAWAGIGQWLVRGPAAGRALAARIGEAALAVDQSDGWVGLVLTGRPAADVLARLAPLDLTPATFPEGAVGRTELRHVPCLLLARAGGGFEILLPRSFAAGAAREIVAAMRGVAARAALG